MFVVCLIGLLFVVVCVGFELDDTALMLFSLTCCLVLIYCWVCLSDLFGVVLICLVLL